jgi:hypothetical protein
MGERSGVYRVLIGKLGGKDLLEGPYVDGRIISRWIFKKWNGGLDWIDLAQDRERWRALVNEVTTFGTHKMLS